MNYKVILSTLGRLLKVEAVLLFLPLCVSLIYKETSYISFVITIIILLAVGFSLTTFLKPERKNFYAREGFIIVGLSWIVMSLFGCLPFVISKQIPNFIDAFFETVSGFTTTGASIISNIDSWYDNAKGLLFYRSFTHWIGGMGVLVFILAIIPKSEGQNIYILKAESTGPKVGKLVSKIKVTARILYLIYFSLTLIETFLLTLDPSMNFFDAIVHSLATAGTGGFGIRSNSVGFYSSYSQIVIAIFMLLFGINFNIFYLILIGKIKQAFKSEELWWYFGFIFISTIAIMIDIYFDVSLAYQNLGIALRDSFFQVSSIITTTGFATVDFQTWSSFSKTILLLLMFVGGCAGSTAGGLKVSRVMILFKSVKREIKKLVHPNSIINIKVDGNPIDEEIVKSVNGYSIMMILILAACLIIVTFNGLDFETNMTAVISCINNIGPGLGKIIGPAGSYAPFNGLSKLTLIFAMLIGRLEIYPILILFNPKSWLNK